MVFSEKAKEQQGKRTDIKQISAESKPIETIKNLKTRQKSTRFR